MEDMLLVALLVFLQSFLRINGRIVIDQLMATRAEHHQIFRAINFRRTLP